MNYILSSNHDWYDITILIITGFVPILTALINVFIVNKNTNKQIANQNKETYRPRLKLKNVKTLKEDNDEHIIYVNSKHYKDEKNSIAQIFEIELENIGNGLANRIKLYNLISGDMCYGYQFGDETKNQVLNSTIEIQKGRKEKVKILVNFDRKHINPDNDLKNSEDFALIICNYKDLNNNDYNVLIGIIGKNIYQSDMLEENIIIDYYYYQEDTKEFNGMVEKYKNNYRRITKQIKDDKK